MAFAGFGSTTANAATATANLGVTATVTNNCTISTAALAFGSYDPVVANASTNLDGTGTVVVACTKGATATIGLGLGGNALAAHARMGDGCHQLPDVRAVSGVRPYDCVEQRWRRDCSRRALRLRRPLATSRCTGAWRAIRTCRPATTATPLSRRSTSKRAWIANGRAAHAAARHSCRSWS